MVETARDLAEAARYSQLALEQPQALGDPVTLMDVLRQGAYRATWQGDYAAAEAAARQALALAQTFSDPLALAGANQNLSLVQIEAGRYQEAHDILRATLDAIDSAGTHHHQKARLLNQMGYLHLELGAPRTALGWDQKAVEAARDAELQNPEMRRYSLLNVATDHLHLGQLEAALEAVAQFEAIHAGADYARFRYFNRYQLLMGELSLARQQPERALAWAP